MIAVDAVAAADELSLESRDRENMIDSTDILEDISSIGGLPDASAGEWFILHTKSRHEKSLTDDLSAKGVAHYLPLVRQIRYYGRRKTIVEAPLFPGYVFLRGQIEEAYDADRSRWVAGIIRVCDQQTLDWELRNLFLAMHKGVALRPHPGIRIGARVEVRSGPCRGLQGIVDRECARGRLILQITTLGQAVSLEIDGSLLDIVE
jgi:transcription antitermination factor NusG